MNNKVLYFAASCVASLAAGFGIGYLAGVHRLRKIVMKATDIKDPLAEEIGRINNDIKENVRNLFRKEDTTEMKEKFKEEPIAEKLGYVVPPSEKLRYVAAPSEPNLIPHVISAAEYETADSMYEKVPLDYYTEDGCLVDVDEIVQASDTIGVDNLKRFTKRNDLMYMYIRNERTGIDYEVVKVVGKWHED